MILVSVHQRLFGFSFPYSMFVPGFFSVCVIDVVLVCVFLCMYATMATM